MKSQHPIFVMGMPRSGTSITCWVIGQHPDIQYHEVETNCFSLQLEALMRNPYRWIAIQQYSEQLLKQPLSEYEKRALMTLQEEALIFDEVSQAIRTFLDTCLLTEVDKKTYVEKTPLHIFYAETIRRIYPDSIFVIPRREKMQVVNSMLKKAWSPQSQIARETFFDIVENEIQYVIKNFDRTFAFEMEDFCLSPENLIEFLIESGISETGMDNVFAAHDERVSVKYLTQPHEKDTREDQERRLAWTDQIIKTN